MNRGYLFGFLIVLLVVILGLYVAFTGFMSSREALQAQAASSSSTGAGQATLAPTRVRPTMTPTAVFIPTPVPGITATLTAMAPISGTEPTVPVEPTGAPPTELPLAPTEPPPAQPTETVAAPPPPTSVPISSYAFRLAGPPSADPNWSMCCYLIGTIRDAAGNGLEGVQVKAFNEWNPPVLATTKGGGEAGQYNIPIGRDVVSWYLVVVDAAGNPISPQVQIQFDPNAGSGYRVNWQRAY